MVFFCLALLIRIIALSRADLWIDEILFVNLSNPPLTPLGIVSLYYKQFVVIHHFPFPSVVQNIFLWMMNPFVEDLDHAEGLQRLPAVVWGSLTVPVLYLLARQLVRTHIAIMAALMMSLFIFPVYYSREAYYYAPLMFFAVSSFYFITHILTHKRVKKRFYILLFASFLLSTYSHMGGVFVPLIFCLFCSCLLLANRYPPLHARLISRKVYLKLWGISFASMLSALPFYLQLFGESGVSQPATRTSIGLLLYDYFGKLFLGVSWPAGVILVLVLFSGFYAAICSREHRVIRRTFLSFFAVLFVALFWTLSITKYNARYLWVVTPVFYIVFALGVDQWGHWIAMIMPRRIKIRDEHIVYVIFGMILSVHLFLFLPVCYQLPAKLINYGGVAKWLVANTKPGTPYLLDECHEFRFMPGYFQTPGRIPACSFSTKPGLEGEQEYRKNFKTFVTRFPEAYWVESWYHLQGSKEVYGEWNWPYKHFRRRFDVLNTPIKKLSDRGLSPQDRYYIDLIDERNYRTPIRYNTAEDIEKIAREEGEPVLLTYEGWQCAQVQQGVYVRVSTRNFLPIHVKTLGEEPVKGNFVLVGFIIAESGEYEVHSFWNKQGLGSSKRSAGSFWTLETPELLINPGENKFMWGVSGGVKKINAIALYSTTFVPSQEEGR